jgi:DNA-binding MarR family transcriptional regulator
MMIEDDKSSRDQILRRIEAQHVYDEGRSADAPLDWSDIGFLCQGFAFAGRPLHLATSSVTQRYDLGPRGAWMLNVISAGVLFPHELSDLFHIGRSLISSELARLTEAGLIVSRPGEKDRRRTELALTELGKEVLAEIRGELAQIVQRGLAGYSTDEIRLCARMLDDMRHNIEPSG